LKNAAGYLRRPFSESYEMAKAKTKRKPNPAFMKPMKPDAALAKAK
jgi:hypothetical protein